MMKKVIARPFVKLEISRIDCKCCVENKTESVKCSGNEVLKVENKVLKSKKVSCCCCRDLSPSPVEDRSFSSDRKLNADKKNFCEKKCK